MLSKLLSVCERESECVCLISICQAQCNRRVSDVGPASLVRSHEKERKLYVIYVYMCIRVYYMLDRRSSYYRAEREAEKERLN